MLSYRLSIFDLPELISVSYSFQYIIFYSMILCSILSLYYIILVLTYLPIMGYNLQYLDKSIYATYTVYICIDIHILLIDIMTVAEYDCFCLILYSYSPSLCSNLDKSFFFVCGGDWSLVMSDQSASTGRRCVWPLHTVPVSIMPITCVLGEPWCGKTWQ